MKFGATRDGCGNHGSRRALVIDSYLRYLVLQMCEKSLGVSSSLNKMAAAAGAAPLQGSTVVRVLVASQLFHTLGDTIYWFC